jgi:NAD(P)-dependent dehydrogenase (short-subunit alcohol dehydrogenase family)
MSEMKLALITGASRGLGSALAEALAPDYHIVAVARTSGALEELDDRIQARGGAATLAPMDICDSDAMAHMCRAVFDRWGRIDLWAHCAIHAVPLSPADHIGAKDWDKAMAINATATQRLIPMMKPLLKDDGTALFFDDPRVGAKFFGAYAATKAAQIALARAWAAESLRTGPNVRILTPPPMPTATRARFFPGEDRAALTPTAEAAAEILTQLD